MIYKLYSFQSLAVIDPKARVIGMRLYEGLFKIIPLEKDCNELKATSLRMEEVRKEIESFDFDLI
jgi:DNA damage-binding protein 1